MNETTAIPAADTGLPHDEVSARAICERIEYEVEDVASASNLLAVVTDQLLTGLGDDNVFVRGIRRAVPSMEDYRVFVMTPEEHQALLTTISIVNDRVQCLVDVARDAMRGHEALIDPKEASA